MRVQQCVHYARSLSINPQRACEMFTVVSLSVCLSTSYFEDGGIFKFETGINVK